MNYFQFKVDPDVNPLCRFCEEQNETFHHYITDCPRLRQYRTNTIGHFDSNTCKTSDLLNFTYYLIDGNLQFLDHNYSLDGSL